jgi:GT2 family glycosyltransferase
MFIEYKYTDSMYPKVTVIVVYYNSTKRRDLIKENILSIKDMDYPNKEVIMVDNGSQDDTYNLIRTETEGLGFKVIKSEENTYWAGGNNLAFRNSPPDTKYYLLVNPDVMVQSDAVKNLVEMMENEPRLGACQGRIIRGWPKGFLDVGRYIGEDGQLYYPNYVRGIDINREYLITYPAGALAILRAEFPKRRGFIFHEIGMMGFDDSVLGIELYMNGYIVKYYPFMTGYHEVSAFTPREVKESYSSVMRFLFLMSINTRYSRYVREYYLSNYIRENIRKNILMNRGANPDRFSRAYSKAKEIHSRLKIHLDLYKAPHLKIPLSAFLLDLFSAELRRRIYNTSKFSLVIPPGLEGV